MNASQPFCKKSFKKVLTVKKCWTAWIQHLYVSSCFSIDTLVVNRAHNNPFVARTGFEPVILPIPFWFYILEG